MESQKIYDLLIVMQKDIKNGFDRVDSELAEVHSEFAEVHSRFAEIHSKFADVHSEFAKVHQKFDFLEKQVLQASKETQKFISNRIRDIQYNHDYLQEKVNEIDRKVYGLGKRTEN